MKRKIINIDEEKCNGCALCIPECKEGAIQIINGKAKLISDLFCDGLGACIGHCPEGAIIIEEREAEPYSEYLVLDKIAGESDVLAAHLHHLIEHNDLIHYNEAVTYLREKGIPNPIESPKKAPALNNIVETSSIHSFNGCPGSRVVQNDSPPQANITNNSVQQSSQLRQWPIQLHLVPPNAPFFSGKELLIMASCCPVASANIHEEYMNGRALVIACPKLDYTEPYRDKLAAIFSENRITKATVLIMEVPCCKGLTKFATDAAMMAVRDNLTIEEHVITLDGKLKNRSVIFRTEYSTT
jgi:ferredoxin